MAVINIKGAIVSNDEQPIYEWVGYEAVSPKVVEDQIKQAKGDDLEVFINSPGGSVHSASEIYTTLKSYPKNVIVKIIGVAASAASVIAMAGKTVLMSPTASIMIHNVSTVTAGDYRNMEHMAEVLRNANKTIANAYGIKTGMREDALLSLMDKETWLTPQQALAYKFIDGIMFNNQVGTQQVSSQVSSDSNRYEKAKAQLNLLKLKGDIHHE